MREITPPPGREQVVVQSVLNARATVQVLWIERTVPAGDPVTFGVRPLTEPPARAEVREEGGGVYSFRADTANPARFLAGFTPLPGRRYDLLVEAEGAVVRATTVVPPAVTILAPAADTVDHPRQSPLQVTWASGTSRQVAVYLTLDTTDVSSYVFPQWVRDDTTAILPGFAFAPVPPSTRLLWVVAADPVTARVFDPARRPLGPGGEPTLDGNVTGGVGVFGAVTSDRLLVRLQ
ncbi:MAG TPA: DUF4249 family protein [Gemmatimonadales bacterium]|nr:DUF4249 family protein [Gemmatimonadales bacterium]